MLQNVSDGADAGSVSGKMIGTSTRVLPATGRESGVPGQVVGAPEARAPRGCEALPEPATPAQLTAYRRRALPGGVSDLNQRG
ncbi:MAG: hypothetical protein KatS3mg056_2122 [Chloroflexus sp.]|nr:MAG: hypothetical protein KatS3mg056_2122 [Chloroflexus sp.]